jgi:hypothetical protein
MKTLLVAIGLSVLASQAVEAQTTKLTVRPPSYISKGPVPGTVRWAGRVEQIGWCKYVQAGKVKLSAATFSESVFYYIPVVRDYYITAMAPVQRYALPALGYKSGQIPSGVRASGISLSTWPYATPSINCLWSGQDVAGALVVGWR